MLIDQDAVVDCDAGLGGEPGARLHTDAHHDEVALQFAPVAGADALDRLVALEALDPRSHQHFGAVTGVNIAVDGADLGPEHPLERDCDRIEDGDLEASLTSRGRDLGADPARADHHQRAAAVEPFA